MWGDVACANMGRVRCPTCSRLVSLSRLYSTESILIRGWLCVRVDRRDPFIFHRRDGSLHLLFHCHQSVNGRAQAGLHAWSANAGGAGRDPWTTTTSPGHTGAYSTNISLTNGSYTGTRYSRRERPDLLCATTPLHPIIPYHSMRAPACHQAPAAFQRLSQSDGPDAVVCNATVLYVGLTKRQGIRWCFTLPCKRQLDQIAVGFLGGSRSRRRSSIRDHSCTIQ